MDSELLLDRQKYAGSYAITPALMDSARMDSFIDEATGNLIAKLSTEVLSHKVADSTYSMTVPYPASPWDHFKYKHRANPLMARWIKRHPISYTHKTGTVTLSKAHRFPESNIRYPKSLGRVVVQEEGRLDYA
jgi:hypothetical protein